MSKKTFAVRIAGTEYKIRSDSSDESLQQIAEYVDRAMQRVRQGTGTVDSLDVAVLTCLNLAREILSLKDPRSGASEVALRTLIERIEEAVPGAGDQDGSLDGTAGSESASEASQAVDGASTSTHTSSDADAESSGRTLDLPSVEALRERGAGSDFASAKDSAGEAIPEARMAAGGRERAS